MTSTARSHHSDQPFSVFDRMPYVFGSSTPREFSYMYQIPAKFRVYDVKLRPSRSRGTKDEMTLSDYIRRIRSSSPKRRRDRSVDNVVGGRSYVFGSSTPRKWSHMDKIPVEYRVYDVRLNGFGPNKRSKTTSFADDYGASNKMQPYGTTAAKSSSLTGVSHHGDSSSASTTARRSNGHSAKASARTRSVPPSASSSQQRNMGATSAATRRTDTSRSSSSSRQKRPTEIHVGQPTNTRTSSSSTKSFDKSHSSITTPNEELMLVVTETVSNMAPSPLFTNGEHEEEAVTSENDRADNRAYSSSIENRTKNGVSDTPANSTKAVALDHLIQQPAGVIHDVTSNNSHDLSTATKSFNNAGNKFESDYESDKSRHSDVVGHNKTVNKTLDNENDDNIVDNVLPAKSNILLTGHTSADSVHGGGGGGQHDEHEV